MTMVSMAGPGSRLYTSTPPAPGDYPEFSIPLRLISPHATGDPGVGLSSTNRIYFQPQNMLYDIPVDFEGGTGILAEINLTNAPAGMVGELYTTRSGQQEGRIRWSAATTSASDIVIEIVDTNGNTDTSTWSIVVSDTGWKWVDAVSGTASAANGGSSTGTRAGPFQTFDDVQASAGAGARCIFKAGTYTLAGCSIGGSSPQTYALFDRTASSVIWIADPADDRPVIDFGYSGSHVPNFRLQRGSYWIQGFETTNSHNMAFQIEAFGTFRHGTFYDMIGHDSGPGEDSQNSAWVMVRIISPDTENIAYEFAMHNCELYNTTGANCFVKLYSGVSNTIRGCWFHHSTTQTEGALALKAEVPSTTILNCKFSDMSQPAIGGNQNAVDEPAHDTKIFSGYNLYQAGGGDFDGQTNVVIDLNNDGDTIDSEFIRDTIRGRIRVQNWDADNGPASFDGCVIVNTDGAGSPWAYILDVGTTDASRLTLSADDNLLGTEASGYLDANGLLTGASRTTYLGTRGHEIP